MKEDEIIILHQGEESVEMELLATFGYEDEDYCCLKEIDSGDEFLFRFYPDGDDMVFEAIEDPDLLEEVTAAYEELLAESFASADKSEEGNE